MTEIENAAQGRDTQASPASVYVRSVAAMSVLFFLGVGLPCWWAIDFSWGLGLGAMCAFWGGPGFGVMAAGAILELRREQEEAHAHEPAVEPLPAPRASARDELVAGAAA